MIHKDFARSKVTSHAWKAVLFSTSAITVEKLQWSCNYRFMSVNEFFPKHEGHVSPRWQTGSDQQLLHLTPSNCNDHWQLSRSWKCFTTINTFLFCFLYSFIFYFVVFSTIGVIKTERGKALWVNQGACFNCFLLVSWWEFRRFILNEEARKITQLFNIM